MTGASKGARRLHSAPFQGLDLIVLMYLGYGSFEKWNKIFSRVILWEVHLLVVFVWELLPVRITLSSVSWYELLLISSILRYSVPAGLPSDQPDSWVHAGPSDHEWGWNPGWMRSKDFSCALCEEINHSFLSSKAYYTADRQHWFLSLFAL